VGPVVGIALNKRTKAIDELRELRFVWCEHSRLVTLGRPNRLCAYRNYRQHLDYGTQTDSPFGFEYFSVASSMKFEPKSRRIGISHQLRSDADPDHSIILQLKKMEDLALNGPPT
jgi:hypothetical protein